MIDTALEHSGDTDCRLSNVVFHGKLKRQQGAPPAHDSESKRRRVEGTGETSTLHYRPKPRRRISTTMKDGLPGFVEISAERETWHCKPELNAALMGYLETRGRKPSIKDKRRRGKKRSSVLLDIHTTEDLLEHYKGLCETIQTHLKACSDLNFKGFEFTGSWYEGTKIDDGVEFDIMLILDGEHVCTYPIKDHPGFADLRLRGNVSKIVKANFVDFVEKKDHVSAQRVVNKFQSFLSKLELPSIKFKRHGPAVQMDVERDSNFYSVDLVPSFELSTSKGKEFYVAKQYEENGRKSKHYAWRQSFSLLEKEIFRKDMGDENVCCKHCLRIIKALRKNDAPMNKLNSYHLKTILFNEFRDHPNKLWDKEHIAERVMDLLGRLEISLASGYLEHHFIGKSVNLFNLLKKENCNNIVGRVRRLRVSEKAFLRCIGKEKPSRKRKKRRKSIK